MTPTPEPDPGLLRLVELWHRACADLVALAREIPAEQWDLPTDLPGWSVKDNVAHTAHLEAVLAGAPEETLEVPDAPHLRSPMARYTEGGVLARRGRDMAELVEEIERSVARRHAELLADPPSDGSARPPRTPGGAPWDVRTLLGNRPFDVWMHEQDVRRAIDRPGGYDAPAAQHALRRLGGALPMVVGKRVAPPVGTVVRLAVPEADLVWSVAVGADGRAGTVPGTETADTTITLTAEELVVLGGGRRPVTATSPDVAGDPELAHRVLGALAVTP